ncbi:MAG: hypothetical protein AAFW73_17305 [Bacteroidota bacterium]
MTLLNNIKSRLRPKRYAGVEMGQGATSYYYHLVVLEEEKGEIKTLRTKRELGSMEALVEALEDKGLPIFLSLNIRGILHKLVPGTNHGEAELLATVLPNAEEQEFWLQRQTGPDGVWASLVRRDAVQTVLDEFAAQELWVNQLLLGPFAVTPLWSFLDRKEALSTSAYQLDFDANGHLQSLRRSTADAEWTSVRVEEETLPSDLLPAFGSAFMGLVDAPDTLAVPRVAARQEEFFQWRIFQTGGWALLLGLLVILVLNTFFYYQYKDRNQDLSSQVFLADTQLERLDSLRAQVGRQEDFMQQTSLNQNSRTSYYADRIAATLPTGLQLSELEIFPILGRERDYREDQLIRYQKDRIRIRGLCKNSLTYNEWLTTLESLDWVDRAEHLEYQDLSSRLSRFELQLFIVPSE